MACGPDQIDWYVTSELIEVDALCLRVVGGGIVCIQNTTITVDIRIDLEETAEVARIGRVRAARIRKARKPDAANASIQAGVHGDVLRRHVDGRQAVGVEDPYGSIQFNIIGGRVNVTDQHIPGELGGNNLTVRPDEDLGQIDCKARIVKLNRR